MKARTVCLVAVGVAAVFAVGLAAKPGDEFAGVRERFHPVVSMADDGTTTYKFKPSITPREIRAALCAPPGLTTTGSWDYEYLFLPDGRRVDMDYSNFETDCTLTVSPDRRPWYRRALGSMKRRIGLDP